MLALAGARTSIQGTPGACIRSTPAILYISQRSSQPSACRQQVKRHNTTSASSPSIFSTDPHGLTIKLAADLGLPLFSASGKQLTLLESPSQFYETLKQKIQSAKSRIVLASLYIGKEETELITCLHSALSANNQLKVTILVDALRSTREAFPSPSCASLISRLHQTFPARVELRLYRTPTLRPWLERIVGKRFNEGWGLQHMKIYGFDDDVLISGANLSRDYFTNRRDRYLLIERHPQICDYLHGLVQTVCGFSYRLETIADERETKETHERKGTGLRWKTVWDGGASLRGDTKGAEIQAYPERGWSKEATRAVQNFTDTWQTRARMSPQQVKGDTLLLPLLQMGPLGIRQETTAIPQLLSLAQETSARAAAPALLNLTSGYFSLYRPYKNLLLKAQASRNAITQIICAAPEANGFFKSKGVSGWIPEAYTWFEYQFYSSLRRKKRLLQQDRKPLDAGGVEIKEWKKAGWTYHAKGVWYTPPPQKSSESAAGPSMFHVGSSNYGSRSSDLDLECTFLISTGSVDLRQRLRNEVQTLETDATDVVDDSLFKRADRQVRNRVKVASWILGGML